MTGPHTDAAEFPTRARSVAAHTLLAAVLVMTVAFPIVTAWYGVPIAVDSLGLLNLLAGQGILAVFLLAWFTLQDRANVREFLHFPAGQWSRRFVTGVRVGVLGWLITLAAMVVLATTAGMMGVRPREGFVDIVVWLATRPVALRLILIATAMVVEEAFFRAFLQPRIGLAAATLCFALSHTNYGSPVMGGGVFVIGLVLGLSFRRHRDVAVCAVAHGVFDAIQLLIVLPLVTHRL